MFEDFGFEPERAAPTLVRLRNCPMHPMTAKAPELFSSVNQAFLAGYLHGLGSDHAEARARPAARLMLRRTAREGHCRRRLGDRNHLRSVSRIVLRLAGIGVSPVPTHPCT
jgi:hypothetical protein